MNQRQAPGFALALQMSNDTRDNEDAPKNDTQAEAARATPRVKPKGKQQVKPGGDAEGGRVVVTEPTRPGRGPAHAGAAGGVPHDAGEAEDFHLDDSVDDSVDFLPGLRSDEAIHAYKTAGAVLASVAALAGLTALVVAAVKEAGEHRGEARRAVSGLFGRRQVDLNRASLAQLREIPGVGHSTALLIVQHRPYGSVAEVRDVTGIRRSAYRELRPHAKV